MTFSTRRKAKRFLNTHFHYEVAELRNGLKFYEYVAQEKKPQAWWNIALEHSLLHIRLLYEFYYDPNGNRHQYPRAKDFVPFNPGHKRYLNKKFWRKVNNQIAHLGTYRENRKSRKGWNIPALTDDMLHVTKDFLDKLHRQDRYYFGKNLKQLYKDWK